MLALAATLAVSGCSGDDVAPRPPAPTATEALWNPCDGLDTARLERLLDTRLTTRTGTDSSPQCSFAPAEKGRPAIDVNYQLYPGTLDELFGSFGTSTGTEVRDLDLPDADGARLVVSVDDDTLAVTGFVQNGELVQLVNAVDPRPYERKRLALAVRVMLRDLAAHADESGLSEG